MRMATIVVADDHSMVRQGLRSLLDSEKGLRVVGETSESYKVVELCEQLQPDILVVDLMMPGQGGLEITRQVRERVHRTKVVVISMHNNEAYVAEALRNGASAYVLKEASSKQLAAAIWAALRGETYLSPPLSRQAVEAYLAHSQAGKDRYALLTSREKEVLPLVAQNLTNKDIADILGISYRTVEIYRANMMKKMGFRNMLDLIRFAEHRGLIPPLQ